MPRLRRRSLRPCHPAAPDVAVYFPKNDECLREGMLLVLLEELNPRFDGIRVMEQDDPVHVGSHHKARTHLIPLRVEAVEISPQPRVLPWRNIVGLSGRIQVHG